ncbi:adenylate/guanylate cyclase domain-containing protein [Planktothricoides raciborskii]|uniref:Adenylate/guanylate cyclase domain-containing protein n=1 Tax=Planktothricoides raciborskii GIHE-MW2 TaxID=2792601 RepID=A0AAU8JBG4_9CYAN
MPKIAKFSQIIQIIQKIHLPAKYSDRLSAFMGEFLGNSGHFLVLKNLSDIAIYGLQDFLHDPTDYLLIVAMLIQTAYLSRPNAFPLLGNLVGVSIYTLVDLPIDGSQFFQESSHVAFWVFSFVIAVLQFARDRWKNALERWIIPLESVVRMLMVLAFYLVVRSGENAAELITIEMLGQLTDRNTHVFLSSSLVLVGLLLGFQRLQIVMQQQQLKKTSELLRNLAEWGMGTHVVETLVKNPQGLKFQRCDRTILFMDIRGFTTWCEQSQPDIVANILNNYYQKTELAAYNFHPLRLTFTADEVMAIYATPEQAIAAAKAMQKAAKEALSSYQLGAGCAVHCGEVVEGLFGGEDVRTYTVIGDVVNTAKRLEGATLAGEITISDIVYQRLNQQLEVKHCRTHKLKGKNTAMKSWVLVE